MAKETLLTRKDEGLGDGLFDSIARAFSEHLKLKDLGNYQSAIMYGNADAPDKIDFYLEEEPTIADSPELIWHRVPPVHCDQCSASRINGVFCHEAGCPNAKKTWVPERQEWVRYVECFNCGCDVEVGTACDCQEPMEDSDND